MQVRVVCAIDCYKEEMLHMVHVCRIAMHVGLAATEYIHHI
jgi:hypothetical protein